MNKKTLYITIERRVVIAIYAKMHRPWTYYERSERYDA